jgi:hypothetical protein
MKPSLVPNAATAAHSRSLNGIAGMSQSCDAMRSYMETLMAENVHNFPNYM